MFWRLVLISLLSLLALTGITGKLIRYVHLHPPLTEIKIGAQKMDQLQKIMQRSGFELLYTRKIYNGSNYDMSVFHYGTCNGLLYMTPIKADEAEIVRDYARDLGTKVRFIYQGKAYSNYPSWVYFISRFEQKIDLVLNKKTKWNYPLVVATIEIGQCGLEHKIAWMGTNY